MSEGRSRSIDLAWCRDAGVADAAADLFQANADAAYISHGELQGGRALAPDLWAPDLGSRVRVAIREAAAIRPDQDGMRLATLTRDGTLVGFTLVRWVRDVPRPYSVIEDLLIAAEERRGGTGARLVEWVAGECRVHGMHRIFLESGIANTRAHSFFERHGFRPVSVVMMRDL